MKKVYIVLIDFQTGNGSHVERVFWSEDKARECARKLRDLYDANVWVDEEGVE